MIGQKITAAINWIGDLQADIFWSTVTSYPAISLMGVTAAVSYAVAQMPDMVARWFPPVMAYTRAAAIVCLVSSAALTFAFGYRVADGRDQIERLENDLAWTQFMLGEQRAAAESADELKKQAEAEALQAKGKLNEYHQLFGDTPGVFAPPRGYLDWLHTLQRHRPRPAAASADRPQRNLVSRVRAFGEKRR